MSKIDVFALYNIWKVPKQPARLHAYGVPVLGNSYRVNAAPFTDFMQCDT